MRFDFSSVDDVESYISVPDGVHSCRIGEVREGRARDGSVRWTFRLEVLDGQWVGRTAAWDSITWSERGVYRVKKVLEALGLDVRGELEIEPQDLVNRQVQVKVEPEEREDPLTGRRQVRMRVPYLGYAPIGRDGNGGDGSEPDPEAVAPIDARSNRGEPLRHEFERTDSGKADVGRNGSGKHGSDKRGPDEEGEDFSF